MTEGEPEDWADEVQDYLEHTGYFRCEVPAEALVALGQAGGSMIVRGKYMVVESTLTPAHLKSLGLADLERIEYVYGIEDER